MMTVESDTAIERFRRAVLADLPLQERLAHCDAKDFVACAVAAASQHGIALNADQVVSAIRPDPLGISRFTPRALTDAVPPLGWLPIAISPGANGATVDWAYFGDHALRESFFEDSIRVALQKPINVLARYHTLLADLPLWVATHPCLVPDGFIFHMSRCGSTLVAQMLAAVPSDIVISEARPIDILVQAAQQAAPYEELLAAIIMAYGSRRSSQQRRFFIKLDSWHSLALPLFRRLFPTVPWIFLYRDPAEVLASQMNQRGIQTVPEYLPPAMFGLSPEDTLPPAAYCARVLSKICEAVPSAIAQGGGLLVNYRELPVAVWERILPHFGAAIDDAERQAMEKAARYDSKAPGMEFSASTIASRPHRASDLRDPADALAGAAYSALETLRQQQD